MMTKVVLTAQRTIYFGNTIIKPTLTRDRENQGLENVCYVSQPLGYVDSATKEKSDILYNDIIFGALKKHGYTAVRGDEIIASGPIQEKIKEYVTGCGLFIADITGSNPMVMFEVGMRQMTNKPIMLVAEGDRSHPPFNLAAQQIVSYDLSNLEKIGRARDNIEEYIEQLIYNIKAKNRQDFKSVSAASLAGNLEEQKKSSSNEERLLQQIEAVMLHSDNPSEVDQLGRQPFAEALTIRLRRVYKNRNKAFFLHIYGPWGSGKTTLLNLIEQEFKKNSGESEQEKWIVIRFNAWQQQRAGPAWWTLTDALYKQSKKQLRRTESLRLRFFENTWRWLHGLSYRFFWPSIILGIIVIVLFAFDISSITKASQSIDDFFGYLQNRVGLVIASCLAIVTGILALSKSLAPGSSHAATEFIKLTNDPMDQISNHYNKLVKWINKPIVVFIDDLDRCQGTYTVELLERIQTLFRDSNVIYIVTADRRWIYTCYEKAYDDFKKNLEEPGGLCVSYFQRKYSNFLYQSRV